MNMSIGKANSIDRGEDHKKPVKWLVVILYTLFIFISLPFVRSIWTWIGDKWGIIILIILYFFAACYVYYKYKKIKIVLFILLASLIIFKFIQIPVERIHFIEYGVLGWMLWWAAEKNRWNIVVTLAYIASVSVLDEVVQGVLPNRFFDWRDIWMNITGGCIGLILRIYPHTN